MKEYLVIVNLLKKRDGTPLFWAYYINEKRKATHTNIADAILFSMSKALFEVNKICHIYPLVR
jgi:hypothetical protein